MRRFEYYDLLEGALVLGFPVLLSIPLQCGLFHALFGWVYSFHRLALFRSRCITLYLLFLLQSAPLDIATEPTLSPL